MREANFKLQGHNDGERLKHAEKILKRLVYRDVKTSTVVIPPSAFFGYAEMIASGVIVAGAFPFHCKLLRLFVTLEKVPETEIGFTFLAGGSEGPGVYQAKHVAKRLISFTFDEGVRMVRGDAFELACDQAAGKLWYGLAYSVDLSETNGTEVLKSSLLGELENAWL